MRRDVRNWLFWVTVSAVIMGAFFQGSRDDDENCYLGVCNGDVLRGVRVQEVAAAQVRRMRWTIMREESDLALAASVLPKRQSAGETPVWFEPGVSAVARRSVLDLLAREYATHGQRPGRGDIGVLVLVDTARTVARGMPVAWRYSSGVATRALWPSPASGGRCVSVVRLGTTALEKGFGARFLLDACAFVDAFGMPGRSIAAALDSGGYNAARTYRVTMPDSVRWQLSHSSFLGWTSAHEAGAFLCAAGVDSACIAHVNSLVTTRPRDIYDWLSLRMTREFRPVTNEAFLDYRAALFDAIAVALGPERFARFWRSDLPIADAYREAAGTSIAELAMRATATDDPRGGRRTGFGMRLTNSLPRTLGSGALAVLAILVFGIGGAALARRPAAA